LRSAKNSFDNKHDNAKDWKRQKKRGNKIIRKSDEQNVENAGMKCQRTTCEYNIHEKCEKKIYKKIKMKEHNRMIKNKAIKQFCVDNKNDDL